MARRISAMVGILIIIALALMLMWRVYLHHHQIGIPEDEPAFVRSGPSVSLCSDSPSCLARLLLPARA